MPQATMNNSPRTGPSTEAVLKDFFAWQKAGIGRYEIIRSPGGGLAAGVEQMVKLRELPESVRAHVVALWEFFGNALKMQITCTPAGPDRIEVYAIRRFGGK